MLTRRKFIEAGIFTQIALSSGILSSLYSFTPRGKPANILVPSLQKTLAAIMDEFIPATADLPSASQTDGLQYIIKLLEKFPDEANKVAKSLADFDRVCTDKFGKNFMELSSKEKKKMLLAQEKDNPAFWGQIRNYTFESFYLSPQIWKLIRHEPISSFSPAF
jgi:Gluconate 2-dehydrogenase subunit 3